MPLSRLLQRARVARGARASPALVRQASSSAAEAAGGSAAAAASAHPPPLYFTAPGAGAGAGAGAARRVISPWHDIPLRAGAGGGGGGGGGGDPAVLSFVCEIPRGTRRKFEISTSAARNPILQDVTKAGAPRSYALDSRVNYGALPQTYEDPAHADAWAKVFGDGAARARARRARAGRALLPCRTLHAYFRCCPLAGTFSPLPLCAGDPLDVCEIGSARPAAVGGAYTVRVLGALALLDGGECDWKLLAVRTDDPLAGSVRDVCAGDCPDGVRREADAVREWFRTYKVPEGKGENDFAFGGAWVDLATALDVVAACHAQWRAACAAGAARPPGALPAKGAPWVPAAGWAPPQAGAFAPARGSAVLAGIDVTRTLT